MATRFDAGDGNDIIYGGNGNDWFIGGKGGDFMFGGAGNDTVDYRTSDAGIVVDLYSHHGSGGFAEGDTFIGIETVIGSKFDDRLTGDDGDNLLNGFSGNDTLHGGGGFDQLYGGQGNDILFSDNGIASFDGGDGIDTANFSGEAAGVIIDLSAGTVQYNFNHWHHTGPVEDLLKVENVVGTEHDDLITGDAGNNVIHGGGGNDQMIGGAGSDTFSYTPAQMFAGNGFGGGFGSPGPFGHDYIADFTVGQDHILFDGHQFGDYASIVSHMTQVGNDTVITLDADNSVTLHNVQMGSLHASDFYM
jgi:Ca2+-binding RTX toxin-like protein